ncbi:MAG: DMT family transporter [Proteobacteria bacterium]|nr:MAG: DMT family transporter [Pseudomonadota bacterium]
MASALVFLLIAMTSIQIGAGVAKSIFPLAGAAGVTVLRLWFATLILWILWRPWRFKVQRSDWLKLGVYGVSLGLMNLTFYFSLERISLGLAVTLEFIGPLALALFSSRKKIDFVWAAMAALGIYFVVPHGSASESFDLTGALLALLAGGFWAAYIFYGQRAGKSIHSGIATTYGMTAAALVILPFGIGLDGPKLLNPSVLPVGVLVAVLSSAIPYSLEMLAMKRLPTQTFGILMSLEPALAAVAGLLILHETLFFTQWLAIGLVIIASLGSVLTARDSRPLDLALPPAL